jgi:hypothetical protein
MPSITEFRLGIDGTTTTEYSDGTVKVGSIAGSVAGDGISVFTPQQFNATAGGGIDDDSAALRAAIDAAVAHGSGVVELGNGTYRCAQPIGVKISRPISIVGEGAWLVIDPSLSGDLLSFSNCWYGSDVVGLIDGSTVAGSPGNAVRWPGRGSRKSGVHLQGFKVIGDRATAGTQNGIVFYDRNDDVLIRDVEINFVRGYGLVLSGIASNRAANAASVMRESHIENVHVRWCGDHLTGRPSVVFNSTDKGSASFDDACNYVEIINLKVIFSDGVGFQTNCYNLNSNSHSNNRVRLILDSPQNLSGASVSGSVASIASGVLTITAGGGHIGSFSQGQYLNNANVPLGTYIASQLTGTAGAAGTYQLANNTLDISTLVVASGGAMGTLRTNTPCMQVGGGHVSESWDVVINASNTVGTGACGIEFNQNALHASTAKTVQCELDITDGALDVALIFTVVNSLAVRWKLRQASTSITALAITQSVVIDLLQRTVGTDIAIGGVVTNLHVRPGGQDVVAQADFAAMNAAKFPNCVLVVNNAGVYTTYVSNGTSWLAVT